MHMRRLLIMAISIWTISAAQTLEMFPLYRDDQSLRIWRHIIQNFQQCLCLYAEEQHAKIRSQMEVEGTEGSRAFHYTLFRYFESCIARRHRSIFLARQGRLERFRPIVQPTWPRNSLIPPKPEPFSPSSPRFAYKDPKAAQQAIQRLNVGLQECACKNRLEVTRSLAQLLELYNRQNQCIDSHISHLKRTKKRTPSEGAYKKGNQRGRDPTPSNPVDKAQKDQKVKKDGSLLRFDDGKGAANMFEGARAAVVPMLEGIGNIIGSAAKRTKGVGHQLSSNRPSRFPLPNVPNVLVP